MSYLEEFLEHFEEICYLFFIIDLTDFMLPCAHLEKNGLNKLWAAMGMIWKKKIWLSECYSLNVPFVALEQMFSGEQILCCHVPI
jgi:hypothetical protein